MRLGIISCALLGAALAFALAWPAQAQEQAQEQVQVQVQVQEAEDVPGLLVFGAGYYDFAKREDVAVDFRLEVRPALNILQHRSEVTHWTLRPFVGVEATTDGAVYGVGGIMWNLDMWQRGLLTFSAGAGGYHDGGGKDLGSTITFQLGAEISWGFENRSRLGLAFIHLSNAFVGDSNPGAEIMLVTYMIPFDWIF